MKWFELSENVIVFRTTDPITLASAISATNHSACIDVVPAFDEVAVQYRGQIDEILKLVENLDAASQVFDPPPIVEIPVCYELGEDWAEVMEATGLSMQEIVRQHSLPTYDVSYGFTPGFVYLGGMSESLFCRRRANPRTQMTAGSVGIGGNKTGIYSLESPGGWQIIGRTPLRIFDIEQNPPALIPLGSKVKFHPISKSEFDHWNESN